MLKLIGSVMIVLSCTVIGFSKSASLGTRCKSLKKLIYSLQIMENEISSGKTRMDMILKKIGSMNGLSFDVSGTETSESAFLAVACNEALALTRSDSEIVINFAKTLGKTDSAVQLKNIKNTISSLEFMENEARQRYEQFGKMYKSIGVLTGLLTVILLI